jgi:FMN reductase
MTAMANRTAISIKVVGLGGSMAAPSRSLASLKLGLAGAQEGAGATTELLDLRELSLPMYVPTTHDCPTAVCRLLDEVYGAHGLQWSSPLYEGTISGAFKNALDEECEPARARLSLAVS